MFPRHGLFTFGPKFEMVINALALLLPDLIAKQDSNDASIARKLEAADLKNLHKTNP